MFVNPFQKNYISQSHRIVYNQTSQSFYDLNIQVDTSLQMYDMHSSYAMVYLYDCPQGFRMNRTSLQCYLCAISDAECSVQTPIWKRPATLFSSNSFKISSNSQAQGQGQGLCLANAESSQSWANQLVGFYFGREFFETEFISE